MSLRFILKLSCSNVKAVQKLNETELRLGQKGSWHDQYSNSAYIFIGELLTLVLKRIKFVQPCAVCVQWCNARVRGVQGD